MLFKWLLLTMALLASFTPVIGNSVRRVQRQVFLPAETCTVSQELIDEIMQLTKSIQSRKRPKRPPTTATPLVDLRSPNDECTQQLLEFKASVVTVINRYYTMSKGNTTGEDYELLKAQQETELVELIRRVDNFQRQVEDRFREEIANLKDSLQELKRKLNEKLRQIEEERAAGRAARETLCVTQIQTNRITAAVSTYEELGGFAFERLVREGYKNDARFAIPVLNFLVALKQGVPPYYTIDGFEKLYDLLVRNNQLNRERGHEMVLSMMGLERYYENPAHIERIGSLRQKIIQDVRDTYED